jgi:arsenate reductase
MAIPHVLFVSTGNACRGQMAEGWLRALGGGRVRVSSAGLGPGAVAPATVTAMAEAGVDISGQGPKGLEAVDTASVTHVITVCDEAAAGCPDFPRAVARRHWSVPDPADLAQDFPHLVNDGFRAIRDNLRDRVWLLLKELGYPPLPVPPPAVDTPGDRA